MIVLTILINKLLISGKSTNIIAYVYECFLWPHRRWPPLTSAVNTLEPLMSCLWNVASFLSMGAIIIFRFGEQPGRCGTNRSILILSFSSLSTFLPFFLLFLKPKIQNKLWSFFYWKKATKALLPDTLSFDSHFWLDGPKAQQVWSGWELNFAWLVEVAKKTKKLCIVSYQTEERNI